ncbi:hypothetical protein A4D02_26945 [Niastella koreensis]|uniref:Heavy metal transport/detoxification protein n=2 Tax=Niastella koreensis TaxID=354356 RepID=G8TFP2_NIAKG|nr:heavy metal-associated domain-containing protein [Niastella koreensis]AEV99481.1 Heavy metal transport/detoxification protein [Niastella koreensis GR20-10]OQP50075.1 hypothetical protein A4D02_26945 [Niastella koreensis]
MKHFICAAVFLVAWPAAKAQSGSLYNDKRDGPFTSTQKIRVTGVCTQCKQTIEKAIRKLPGVYLADWDVESQLLLVRFNRSNITLDKIEKLVAETGHDTQHVKAIGKEPEVKCL